MPYVPIKNGPTVWIEDPEEAKKKYEESWGIEGPEAEEVTAEVPWKPGTMPTTDAQSEQMRTWVKQKEKEVGFWEGGIDKQFANIPRRLINDPIAAVQKFEATTRQAGGYGGILGGPMPQDPEEVKRVEEERQFAVQALEKTGRKPDASHYGISQNVPVLGTLFSDDSKWVKENVKPVTPGGRLISSIGAVVLSDVLTGAVLQKPTQIKGGIKVFKGFGHLWKNKAHAKAWKDGMRSGLNFLFRELLPNAAQDIVYFAPTDNPDLRDSLDGIQKLPPESREAAMRVLLATTDTDWSYAWKTFEEVTIGAASLVSLKALFRAGNKVLRKGKGLLEDGTLSKEVDKAIDEVAPEAQKIQEVQALSKAHEIRETELGKINTKLYKGIDDTFRNFSLTLHEVTESFLNKNISEETELGQLALQVQQDIAAKGPDADLTKINERIKELEFDLVAKTPEARAQKRKAYEARLADYEEALQNDPNWIKGKSGLNPKRPKARRTTNRTKLRNVRKALDQLNELDDLIQSKEGFALDEAARAERLKKVKSDIGGLFRGGVAGVRRVLIKAKQEINALDALNAQRMGELESKNAQLVYEGRANEVTPELQLTDEVGLAYLEGRKIVNEGLANKRWDIGYIQTLVARIDEIHDIILKNGGTAPVVAQGVEEIKPPTPKAPQERPPITLQEFSKPETAEALEEFEKLAKAGNERSLNQIVEAASEYYGVPFEETYSLFNRLSLGEAIKRLEEGPRLGGEKNLIEPRKPAVSNEVPIKPDSDGNPRVNSDKINEVRAANSPPPPATMEDLVTKTKKLNRDKGQFVAPKNKAQIEEAASILGKRVEKLIKDSRHDLLHGTDFVEKDSTWYNTSTLKYTPEGAEEQAAILSSMVDKLADRGLSADKIAMSQSAGILTEIAGNPEFVKVLLKSSEKYAEDVKKGLFYIPALTSLLDNSSSQLLKATRDLENFQKYGGELPGLGGGWSEKTLLQNFKNRYLETFVLVKNISKLFEGFGNGLRLFQKQYRLAFQEGKPELVQRSYAGLLDKWKSNEKFYTDLVEANKTSRAEIEKEFAEFIELADSGKPIPREKWEGIKNLTQAVIDSKGNLAKLKQLEVTGPTLFRRVQSGGMISNPATVVSIPFQAIPDSLMREIGYTGTSYLNAAHARWISKNLDGYEDAIAKAKMHQNTILNLRFSLGEAFDSSLNRFLYGKSIADPGASNRAWEINSSGLLREDEITSDLNALQFKLPFTEYVLKKEAGEQDVLFDTLNRARVLTKVFHDYAVAGEAWNKRSFFSKWLLAAPVTAAKKLGFGDKSFYSSGEHINMTLPFQLAALGDEFSSAWWGNARARTLAEIKVDEDINAGLIGRTDRADQLKLELSKSNEKLYRPVTAGLDNTVIGHEILDEQIREMTRAVNLTEELEGPFKAVGEWINTARYNEEHPVLSAFANTMAGVVTSPLNGIKWGIRWGTGVDMYHASADAVALGAKSLAEHLPEQLQKRVSQNGLFQRHLKDFESKYWSSDLNTRVKAQGALAVAVGMHTTVFFQIRDPGNEVTGALENTYRQEQGQVGLFTMRIQTPWGPWRMPYRWIPIYGQVMAFQATMRDIEEFGTNKEAGNIFGAVAAATANYIMETPGLASAERIMKAVSAAGQGDPDKLAKFASQAFAGAGEPYLQFRKFVTEGIDPRKPADPYSKYQTQQFWEEDPDYKGPSGARAAATFMNAATDTVGSLLGYTQEYSAIGFLTDEIVSIVKGHPEGRSRRALYYGVPGETVNASHAGKWYPIQGALGRYWPFPDKLDDEVKREMVVNLIQPPKQNLYQKDGIRGINRTVLNDFNHFLNSEFQYYDPIRKKNYVGIHSAIKDLVNSKYYQSLPRLDSPYAMGGYRILPGMPKPFAPEQPNWDRSKNVRRTYLSNYVRSLITKAKEDFMLGEQEGQRYKAPEELKQAILNNRRGGSN